MEEEYTLKEKKNILFEGRWENGEKNGIFIVKNGLEDKKEFIQQYKNGALFNEFLNKQQFDDLKNEIEDQKYNRLHQQKEIFDKFF